MTEYYRQATDEAPAITAAGASVVFCRPLSSSVVPYVPKSYPGTEIRGISWLITRSIVLTIAISSAHMNV